VDPDGELDELFNDNNVRKEPVVVGEKLPEEDPAFYYTYLLVLVLLIAWLVIYYMYRRRKKVAEEPKDLNVETENTKKIKRAGYQRPKRR
jgi:cbb3-type cytochrome oxidase subunit 3